MTDLPSVGVLITYFGERELLRECLESLARQTHPVDEILVYDDASDAPAVAYIPHDVPVTIIRAEINRGPGYGRNELLHASTSTYVHFHDADDLFAAAWWANVATAIVRSQPDVVFTEVQSFDSNGVVRERVLELEKIRRGLDLVRFCINGAMLTPSGTYRRTKLLASGGYRTDLAQSEDWEFHIRLAASGIRYELLLEPLVGQRLRDAGRHHQSVDVWVACCQAVEGLAQQLPAKYRSDLADAAARAGSQLFALGARAQASRAFDLAAGLGATCAHQRPIYRVLARTVGFEMAEQLALAYRRVLPSTVRAHIAGSG